MIGYITLGTADIKRGAAFFDAISKRNGDAAHDGLGRRRNRAGADLIDVFF